MEQLTKKPVVNGRASICEWSLRAEFKTKEQAKTAIKKILDLDIDFPVEYEKHMDSTHDIHCVLINGMSWAGNLITVAKILEEVDYNPD